jgi:zinc-ribbon domain/Putative prokaryotic signal transducing protein
MAGDVIQIASFSTTAEAQLYLSALQEAEIAAFLTGEQTAGAFSGILPLGPQIHLFVARADLKRARDVFEWTWNGVEQASWGDEGIAEEGYWPCPKCGDAVPESDAACPSCGTPLEDHPG